MQGLKYLIVITKREYAENYIDFFHRHGVSRIISSLCNGTANENTLNLMGIEKTEKVMFQTMIRDDIYNEIKSGLIMEMDISAIGNGVALFVPIDSIGGNSSLKYLVGEKPLEKKESGNMENVDSKIVMIITVVDKGNTELVMNAARTVGANGGTVVRAKGTGAEIAKFFGVSISEEKELVYIVTSRESRDSIMKAIMEKAGTNTNAHGVIFTLPVDSVAGIKGFENI